MYSNTKPYSAPTLMLLLIALKGAKTPAERDAVIADATSAKFDDDAIVDLHEELGKAWNWMLDILIDDIRTPTVDRAQLIKNAELLDMMGFAMADVEKEVLDRANGQAANDSGKAPQLLTA